MKKYSTMFALLALVIAIGCKKKEKNHANAKSAAELLLGEWDITHEAYDENHNGMLDEGEINIRQGDQQWLFEENGHAAMTYYTYGTVANQDPCSYTLNGNILTITKGSSYTQVYIIEELTESKLRWQTTSFSDTVWRMYRRK